MAKHIHIVWHSKTGNTAALVKALFDGISHSETVKCKLIDALNPSIEALTDADFIVFATPENFGYMSGGLKHFFDETYYEVEELQLALPYFVVISAGNDGTGAAREIHRIMAGYGFHKVVEDQIIKGIPSQNDLDAFTELGIALAEGLSLGIY
jgi:multimeric flavodoxin WrbA